MRRRLSRLALLVLAQALASCGPGPTVVTGPQSAEFGGASDGNGRAPGDLPMVPVRWEEQPTQALEVAGGDRGGAPVSLTSPDGVGLVITSLEVAAAVEDPLAFTELHFTFKNPEARTIEGRFELVLPPGATISRFAMKNADGWKEGEVVELQAARVAYEDFLHRRADPALLEKQAGNRFQARVFPIPASGEKEIIVSYSQSLASRAEPYRAYLRGLPRMGKFDMRVIERRRGDKGEPVRRIHSFKQADFAPDRDFVLPLAAGTKAVGLRHEELAVGRVTPIAENRLEPVRDLLVLLDTSASRALDLATQAERLAALLTALPDEPGSDMPIAVACFDQGLEPVYVGPKKGFGRKEIEAILQRKALGASDLGLALESAAGYAKKQGGRFTRALLLTDGIPTAGPTTPGEIAADLQQLRDAGIRRLDALVAGGIRDEALLRRLTTGTFPQDGVVLDAAESPRTLADRLGRATVSGLKVRVPGAKWVYPEKLDAVQPGDEALVYAEIPSSAPFEVEVEGPSGTARTKVETEFAERPLLERAAARANIERLSLQMEAAPDEGRRAAIGREIVSLSTRFRVLSDLTALLVLETENDYARFGIDRTALVDILVVGRSGVELQSRKGGPVTVAASPDEPAKVAQEKNETETKAGQKKDTGGAPPGAPPAQPAAAPAGEAAPPPPPPQTETLSREELKQEAKPEPAEAEPSPRPASAPRAAAKPAAPSAAGASRPRRIDAESILDPFDDAPSPRRPPSWRPPPRPPSEFEEDDDDTSGSGVLPYEGKFAEVMSLIQAKKHAEALSMASAWRDAEPGDALALIALGESFEGLGNLPQAARAYGSIIDLFPSRADLRRFAGARLERIGPRAEGVPFLVVDTYEKAVASRPDHPSGHRLLAYALARAGKYAEAFEVITAAFARRYPSGRFAGVRRVLADDVGILAAALIHAKPERRAAVQKTLNELGVPLATRPSLRFVLTWETDANDVDFHIRDSRRGHAYYGHRKLRSGGELFADVTTGYGPECFAIDGRAAAYPYRLQAHYYSKGPMGYGMGKLQIVEHDGNGEIRLEERPFVVMTDRAFVDLGVVTGKLPAPR
ncbi:VIT domain-containing protein [Polyangium sp. y55x31]|uniref:VIT domain-containing protein n=1 Tax=Polyangium sp. y55x31 TaxID=3042688 RepID=UPI002482641D|nr:VIT domain-containing protein [Polyangium sp. y55x31]MDI1478041.1 VIT domain-containing protein [Polyangium sp. y55x31]